MGVKKDIISTNKSIVDKSMEYETINYVPGRNNKSIKGLNVGKKFHAVVFYIDMRGSTILVKENRNKNVGRIHKAYFNTVVNCIECFGGKVVSLNGDSVLAFFYENSSADNCDNAIKTAGNINFLLNNSKESLNKLIEKYGVKIDYGIGITMDNIQCVAIGDETYSNYYDKMWISAEVNFATKISNKCSLPNTIGISSNVQAQTSIQKFSNGHKIWKKKQMPTGEFYFSSEYKEDSIL